MRCVAENERTEQRRHSGLTEELKRFNVLIK